VDAIVLTDISDFHFERRGEQIMNKEKLLAVGDKFEKHIAETKAADAPYR
jgi:NADH-quinone oxidoreductase subunit I